MREYSKFYDKLNDRQKKAVDTIDGPLLVLAGPGTGKTLVLSVRAGSILAKKDIRPENILILTYTNSAAKAMKERLASVIGNAGYEVEVGTFHSFANSVIQESEEAAFYIGDKVQMSDVERMRAIEYILDGMDGLDDIRPFRAAYTYLKEILQRISDLKKDGISPSRLADYLNDPKSLYNSFDEKYIKRLKAFSRVYARYEELKEGKETDLFDERGRYDFDDMILFATEVLKKEPALRKEYGQQYKYVMVDEFQDTNGAQLELLFELLEGEKPNVLCVGDDDQSIYRFQGASIENFKTFSKRYPAIKTVHLKDNYRSSEELVRLSAGIIKTIPARNRIAEKKLESVTDYENRQITFRELTTEEEELIYIVDKLRELKKAVELDASLTAEERARPYNSIAVLLRKRSDILKIIDTFLRSGIPYATDGKEDITKEMRVKQLLDVLDLAHIDPSDYELKDLALYKVLASDYMQIPQSDILKLFGYMNKKKASEKSPGSVLEGFLEYFSAERGDIHFEKPANICRAHSAISHLLADSRTKSVHSILMDFIKDTGMFKFILREYADNGILRIRQMRALASFVNMIKTSDIANPSMRLDDFMDELKTRKEHGLPVQGELVTLTQEGVRVYTAHGSKGLEFHSVIIPFCLHNKNWPARPIYEKIPLPSDLIGAGSRSRTKESLKELNLYDETRLFYVAATRARANLVFTASPAGDSVASGYLNELAIRKEEAPPAKEEPVIARSLEQTDAKDPFIGTEEVLRDMIANMSLNPTRLNTYTTCKRKFLYNDVLKLPGPKKKSLVFGNCVHKSLEDAYGKFMKTKIFPGFDFFMQSFKRELVYQGVDKVMQRDCLNKAKTLKGCFAGMARNSVMPIGLEKKLIVTIGDNIIFTGKYDKVEWEDERQGLVRIIDYKTGKPDEHLKSMAGTSDVTSSECDGYLRQLVCYRLLYERGANQPSGRRVSNGVLLFLEPLSDNIRRLGYKKGQYVARSVRISDEMIEKVEDLIKETFAAIRRLEFDKLPERDEAKCGKCDFNIFCWE